MLSMFLIGISISIGDEILQAVLPWRVYDLRDVALNVVSFTVGWGIAGLSKRAD